LLASDLKGFPFHKNEQKRAKFKNRQFLKHVDAELRFPQKNAALLTGLSHRLENSYTQETQLEQKSVVSGEIASLQPVSAAE
jgi:hypothetical protein